MFSFFFSLHCVSVSVCQVPHPSTARQGSGIGCPAYKPRPRGRAANEKRRRRAEGGQLKESLRCQREQIRYQRERSVGESAEGGNVLGGFSRRRCRSTSPHTKTETTVKVYGRCVSGAGRTASTLYPATQRLRDWYKSASNPNSTQKAHKHTASHTANS